MFRKNEKKKRFGRDVYNRRALARAHQKSIHGKTITLCININFVRTNTTRRVNAAASPVRQRWTFVGTAHSSSTNRLASLGCVLGSKCAHWETCRRCRGTRRDRKNWINSVANRDLGQSTTARKETKDRLCPVCPLDAHFTHAEHPLQFHNTFDYKVDGFFFCSLLLLFANCACFLSSVVVRWLRCAGIINKWCIYLFYGPWHNRMRANE